MLFGGGEWEKWLWPWLVCVTKMASGRCLLAQVLVQVPEFWLRVSQDPVRVLSACHLHALSARLRSLHSSSAGCCFASAFALHSCVCVWLLLWSRSWFKLSSSRGRIRLSSCRWRRESNLCEASASKKEETFPDLHVAPTSMTSVAQMDPCSSEVSHGRSVGVYVRVGVCV